MLNQDHNEVHRLLKIKEVNNDRKKKITSANDIELIEINEKKNNKLIFGVKRENYSLNIEKFLV